MGASDGSIIAAIITVHMPTKHAAASAQPWPHSGVQSPDSVQPPGMGMSPMPAIDTHQTMVAAALAANSRAAVPKKAARRWRSGTARRAGCARRHFVLVMPAPPDARLVASERGTIEPLVRAPERVQSARIGGVRVVDRAALADERADAGALACVRGHVGPRAGREFGHRPFAAALLACAPLPRRLAPVVVLDALAALLRFGEGDVEVGVELAVAGRCPGEGPAHALPVRPQLRERCARHRAKRDVMLGEVDGE